MTCRRLVITLALAVLIVTALLPLTGHADAPQPPLRSWEERRHPETALDPGAAAVTASGQAADPDLFPYERWSRVAFQSYRTADWEIYVSYPNGAGERRVTYHPAQDTRPRLDSESRRVVWVSDRDGNQNVYAANVDGSNTRRLTDADATDDDPVWSPDGATIAFASDRNGDWDIYVMNADGSGVRRMTDLAGDDRGPTWSPDGRLLAWIHAEGERGAILAMPAAGGAPETWARDLLMPARLAWAPDGQFIGFDAPAANPGWANVYRVRRGGAPELLLSATTNDVWMNSWSPDGSRFIVTEARRKATGSVYGLSLSQHLLSGAPGDIWQSAGMDAFADWKSQDARPPVTQLDPLPRFARDRVTLTWQCNDTGSVGVEYYEIEQRINDGPAELRRIDRVGNNSYTVTGVAGETRSFRLRAVDGAGNVEPWDDAPARVTFFNWQISGRATDTRGNPLPGAVAAVSGATTLAQSPSSETEPYRTCVAADADALAVTWRREPYLALPSTRLPARADAQFDVVLPSPDNLLSNWGFEEGDLAGWRTEGTWPPVVSTATRHTGQQSAALGAGAPLLAPAQTLAPALADPSISAGVDAQGRGYFATGGAQDATPGPIYLSIVGPDGNLQAVEQPNAAAPYGLRPTVAVAADGTVDLVWAQDDLTSYAYELWHRRRDPSGAWSAPTITPLPEVWMSFAVANDGMGNSHLVANQTRGTNRYLVYLRRTAAGVWDAAVDLSAANDTGLARVAADAAGRVHVMWTDGTNTRYRLREANGAWGPVELVAVGTHSDGYFDLAVDRDGRPHALLIDSRIKPWSVRYAYRGANGEWQTTFLDGQGAGIPQIVADETGVIHGVWARSSGAAYWRRAPDEPPTDQFIVGPGEHTSSVRVAAAAGVAYVAWLSDTAGSAPLHWRQATATGWGNDYAVARISSWKALALVTGAGGRPLLAWHDGEARYMQPAVAATSGRSGLARDVALPETLAAPTLSFMAKVEKPWADAQGRFEARVRDANLQTTVLGAVTAETAGWQHLWFDLTPWQGQAVTIELAAAQAAGGAPIAVYLDEVTLGSGLHADTWAQAALQAIPPGETGALTIRYGNRGNMAAPGAALRLTLPPGITLVSAAPPAQGSGGEFEWPLGALAAESEGAIEVALRNDSTAANPGRLTVTITPGPGELEPGNNTMSAWVWGYTRSLLPVILR